MSGTRPCTSWPEMKRSKWEYRGAPGGSASIHLTEGTPDLTHALKTTDTRDLSKGIIKSMI